MIAWWLAFSSHQSDRAPSTPKDIVLGLALGLVLVGVGVGVAHLIERWTNRGED